VSWFQDARLSAWVEAQLRVPDMRRAFVFSSAMAPYLMHARRIFRVLDLVDVDSEKWAAYAAEAKQPMRTVWAREARTLLAMERRAVAAFDHALLVSEHEWRHFAALAPDLAQRAGWVRNGVDLRWFDPALHFASPFGGTGRHIVFTGRMDYRPNIDAVCWFAREVMPALQRRCADTQFWIVGAAPAPAVKALAALPRVRVTSRVDDTRPYIAHAAAIVAPLRIARGVQNKVLEAMAMARPVVTTPAAFEGIDACPGQDLLLAEDAAGMAARVAEVLEGRHPALGAAARSAVEAAHQWPVTLRPLDRLFAPAPQKEPVG
jgi:sugar transferase (PEP-CTERM/EpsH1 system associated)